MRKLHVAAIAIAAIAVPTTAAVQAAVKPVVISITAINGRPVGGIKRPSVKRGQTIKLVIRTNVGTELHLHGYDIEKIPRKGVPTVMRFVAKTPGRFELELHDPDALLAQLTVRP